MHAVVMSLSAAVLQLQHQYAELSGFSAKSLSADVTKEVFTRCLSQVASKCVGMGDMRVLIVIDGADRMQVCLPSKCIMHTMISYSEMPSSL